MDFLGGSLVQAKFSCCTCLSLGNLTEVWHVRSPSSLLGGASGAQRLVLPPLSHFENPCSKLLSLPPWYCALQEHPVPGLGGLNRLTLGVVQKSCNRGGGLLFSFLGLCWLISLESSALFPHNAAEGPTKRSSVPRTKSHMGDTVPMYSL